MVKTKNEKVVETSAKVGLIINSKSGGGKKLLESVLKDRPEMKGMKKLELILLTWEQNPIFIEDMEGGKQAAGEKIHGFYDSLEIADSVKYMTVMALVGAQLKAVVADIDGEKYGDDDKGDTDLMNSFMSYSDAKLMQVLNRTNILSFEFDGVRPFIAENSKEHPIEATEVFGDDSLSLLLTPPVTIVTPDGKQEERHPAFVIVVTTNGKK